MIRTILAAALATTLGTAAHAQTALVEIPDATIVQPFGIAAGLLDDVDVYTSSGVEVGDVEEIVGTDVNTPTHLVVDFDDNAGFPDRDDVIVPIDAFTLDANRLVISLEPGEIGALPIWND